MDYEQRDVTPSHVVNSLDHGGLVVMAAAFCIVCSSLFFGIRLIIRWPWRTLFGKDDAANILAVLLSIAQIAVMLNAIPHGLGKPTSAVSAASAVTAKKLIYASNLLYICTVFVSKLAVILLFGRLASSSTHKLYGHITAMACGVFWLASFLTVAAQRPWGFQSVNAHRELSRWIAMEVFSNILDVCIALLPLVLVKDLQTKISVKITVVLGFALRLPLIALSVIRLVSLSHSLNSDAFLFNYAITEIYTQVEMLYGIVSATVPCLRIFLRAANTHQLAPTITTIGASPEATKMSVSHRMSMLRSKRSNKTETISEDTIELADKSLGESEAKVSAASDKTSMISEPSESAIVVRQTVDVHIE